MRDKLTKGKSLRGIVSCIVKLIWQLGLAPSVSPTNAKMNMLAGEISSRTLAGGSLATKNTGHANYVSFKNFHLKKNIFLNTILKPGLIASNPSCIRSIDCSLFFGLDIINRFHLPRVCKSLHKLSKLCSYAHKLIRHY